VTALELARRALEKREIDAALVGAVDVGCEPVHAAAAAHVLPPESGTPGDAAVVIVLKRLEDARRDGDAVHALLRSEGAGEPTASLTPLFGHAHAASGLLQLAAAAAACRHRAQPRGEGAAAVPWLPTERDRLARVNVEGMAGSRVGLSPGPAATSSGSADKSTPAIASALFSCSASRPSTSRMVS